MNKTVNILLVDDHPIIIEAYTNSIQLFKNKNDKIPLYIDAASCCDSSLESLKNKTYDVVFLDIRIPSSTDRKFKSGVDIALFINKHFPETKTVLITGHYDEFLLSNIVQTVSPFGLLLKGDIDQKVIAEALKSILQNSPFYSSSILKLFRKNLSSNIVLDKKDKQLLMGISEGKRTSDLIKIMPLSKGGLEKRKRQLKTQFGLSNLDDDNKLVSSAKEKGFL